MCVIEVILPAVIVDRVVDKLRSYIATVTRADFTRHTLTGELILQNRLIAHVAVRRSGYSTLQLCFPCMPHDRHAPIMPA